MRGYRTLFSDLYEEPAPVKVQHTKGRNGEKHAARNECLVARFHYYRTFFNNQYAYDWIINTVAKEFWLSPATVPEVINECYTQLALLKATKPTVKTFKEKWPHLVWELSPKGKQ